MSSKRDTYKYHFKVGNAIVQRGVTNNLKRRATELKGSHRYTTISGKRHYWRDGHIVQVGHATTKEAALEWKKKQR